MTGELRAAVIQDEVTGRVLMLGWMDQEAFDLTVATGQVHFWSRSRQTIWRKGETSGNTLEVVEVRQDCDHDAFLVLVRPTGPVCHTGSVSCFDDGPLGEGFLGLERLWSTITQRVADRPAGSYTVRLVEGGPDLPARKLVEEATEVLIAAKDHATGANVATGDLRLAEEMADLVYHLLVVCAERGVPPERFLQVLEQRHRPA